MKCIYCNNTVTYGDWSPSDEIHTANHGDNYGWCHNCSLPVFYTWKFQLPNDRQFMQDHVIRQRKDIITSHAIFNSNPNESCYAIHNFMDTNTGEVYRHNPYQLIVRLPFLININPNNFHQKLKTLIVFS